MKTASSYTSARYIPVDYRAIILRASRAWAIAHSSDPFAYMRMLTHLTNKNCITGLASDVLDDALRIMGPEKAKLHGFVR